MLAEFISSNFITLATLILLVFFIVFNDAYEHRITVLFTRAIALLLLLIIIDNIRLYAEYNMWTSKLHVVMAMLGFDVRVFLLYEAIYILTDGKKKKVFYRTLIALCCINAAVELLALFTPLLFYYTANGREVRRALSFTPHVLSSVLVIYLLGYAFSLFSRKETFKAIVSIFTGIIICISVFLEIRFSFHGLLRGAIAMMLFSHYVFLHLEHFKRDVLTGVLNRSSFYADMERFAGRMVALISIDLNGLKEINDTQGHIAGDYAICSMAEKVRKILPANCCFYRVGGDEFMVACLDCTFTVAMDIFFELRNAASQSSHSWAVGIAEWKSGDSLTHVYSLADANMYENKHMMKAERM